MMKAPDGSAGKKAKCPLCGTIQIIPSVSVDQPPIELEQPFQQTPPTPPQPSSGATITCGHCGKVLQAKAALCPDCGWVNNSHMPFHQVVSTDPVRSFWSDASLSFSIPFKGAGGFLFGFVVLMHFVRYILDFAGCLGSAGQFIITGWLCSYFLNIIQDTCTGQDELPGFNMADGYWEGILRPFLLFLGGTVLVMLPVIVWALLVLLAGGILGSSSDAVVGIILLAIGLFLWPMTILTVAVQGFSINSLRYDKQLATIGRALSPYLAVWLLLIVVAVGGWASMVGSTVVAGLFGIVDVAAGILIAIIAIAIFQSYFSIVVMRTIGLYYRHYKKSFAWIAE